jgi:hypothetical protein
MYGGRARVPKMMRSKSLNARVDREIARRSGGGEE